MIPAKVNCPSSWTREYYGYLMTERFDLNRNSFECVDVDAEILAGSVMGGGDGAFFYFTESRCASGNNCPPYVEGRELPCVVCTK